MLRIVLLLVIVHSRSALCRYPTDNLVEEEVSLWCKDHPFGRIYSYGEYHTCSHELEDWEELRIKTLRMKGVQLRVGIILGKTGYDYDCGGYLDGSQLVSKDTYGYYILNLLREILEFDVQFVVAETWGMYDKVRKNWTGLVGLAMSGRIDMAICHTTITEDREDVVDFLLSTLSSTRALVYNPSRLPLTRDVFVLTFTPMLWLSFFASVVLLILCFRFSTWQHSKLRPDHEPWSWIEVIMWANAAICQQSYSRHPKGSSCRTTFLIGYMITYLLYTGFAAGVTSLLAVQGHDTHLGFSDVVGMNLKLVVQTDGTHFDFLRNSPDTHARYLYTSRRDVLEKNRAKSMQDLFSRLNEDRLIGLGTTVALQNYLRRTAPSRLREFTVSPIINTDHQKAFILPKKSPYREIFNYWLLRIVETGLLDFATQKYIHIDSFHYWQQTGWSSAGLGNVFSAVVIICGGWFFSVIILFGEMAWKRKTSRSDWEIASRRDIQIQLMQKNIGI